MAKIKIDFKKLLNRQYPLYVELEVINWFMKNFKGREQYVDKWNRVNLHSWLFKRSASDAENAPFPVYRLERKNTYDKPMLDVFIDSVLSNAIVKETYSFIQKWREDENVLVGKSRFIEIPEPTKEELREVNLLLIGDLFNEIMSKTYSNKYFHPKIPERIDPKITQMFLTSNGNGYKVVYEFDFKNFDYKGGWEGYYYQQANENIYAFLIRMKNDFNSKLI